MTLADALTSTGRWDQFAPFTGLHLVTVTICLAVITVLVLIGRSLPNQSERRLRLAMAVFAIAEWTIYNTAWNWSGIDLRSGLPLHICDIGGLLAPFALITQNRWLRATLYFWAFALTTQAFIQPTLTAGPSLWLFWCFWTSHTIILGYAIYDLAVLRFRPSGGDFGRAMAVSIGYFAVVMPVNVVLGRELRIHRKPGLCKGDPTLRGGARPLASTCAHHHGLGHARFPDRTSALAVEQAGYDRKRDHDGKSEIARQRLRAVSSLLPSAVDSLRRARH